MTTRGIYMTPTVYKYIIENDTYSNCRIVASLRLPLLHAALHPMVGGAAVLEIMWLFMLMANYIWIEVPARACLSWQKNIQAWAEPLEHTLQHIGTKQAQAAASSRCRFFRLHRRLMT